MGEIRGREPVLLLMGVLAADAALYEQSKRILIEQWGDLCRESTLQPFAHTRYYETEMGPDILRAFVFFKKWIDPAQLADIKVRTNEIEKQFSQGGKRRVNLDPGYIELSKLVLASTKNFSHRLYIGQGIYAELTLRFQKDSYTPVEWTYPDYQTPEALALFNETRAAYHKELKAGNYACP